MKKQIGPEITFSDEIEMLIGKRNKNHVKADSAILYARDSLWPDELRLVGMFGVKMEEPMHGFAWPSSAKRVIQEGDERLFIIDSKRDGHLRSRVAHVARIPKSKRKLFQDFVGREEVTSTVRLTKNDAASTRTPVAVLFINFCKQVKFSASLKREIEQAFEKLVNRLALFRTQHLDADAQYTWPFISNVVSPAWSLANLTFQNVDNLKDFSASIMGSALIALGCSEADSFGTIHLYEAEQSRLRFFTDWGPAVNRAKADLHDVSQGEGVISWVALCKRSLLIRDLSTSKFRIIHRNIGAETKSELAVPVAVDGDVLGVMCLESNRANAFRPEHVRLMWYAANKLAVAYKLYQHAATYRKLLELNAAATRERFSIERPSDDLASLVAEFARAGFCDIWKYNRLMERFDLWGASYTRPDSNIRKDNGWTRFVLRTAQAVWISDIRNKSKFERCFWADNGWTSNPTYPDCPEVLNDKPIEQAVWAELALPIVVQKECIGVIWIKYRRMDIEPPGVQTMEMLRGFTSQAGLVMECLEYRISAIPQLAEVQAAASGIAQKLKPIFRIPHEALDAYAETVPLQSILGGDFCSVRVLGNGSVGILLVDATNHGIPGALNMLPLRATYETHWKTESTAFLMGRLRKTAKELGVTAEALYFVVSSIEGKTWISVTRGLQFPILRFRREQHLWNHDVLPNSGTAGDGPLLTEILEGPLGQDTYELRENDVLIACTDGLQGRQESRDNVVNLMRRCLTTSFDRALQEEESVSASALAQEIIKEAKKEQGGHFTDDVSIVVVVIRKNGKRSLG